MHLKVDISHLKKFFRYKSSTSKIISYNLDRKVWIDHILKLQKKPYNIF